MVAFAIWNVELIDVCMTWGRSVPGPFGQILVLKICNFSSISTVYVYKEVTPTQHCILNDARLRPCWDKSGQEVDLYWIKLFCGDSSCFGGIEGLLQDVVHAGQCWSGKCQLFVCDMFYDSIEHAVAHWCARKGWVSSNSLNPLVFAFMIKDFGGGHDMRTQWVICSEPVGHPCHISIFYYIIVLHHWYYYYTSYSKIKLFDMQLQRSHSWTADTARWANLLQEVLQVVPVIHMLRYRYFTSWLISKTT